MKQECILLLSGAPEDMDPDQVALVKYPHPKDGNVILFGRVGNDIYELQTAEPNKYSSWFVGDRIISSPYLYLGSKMDPLFICLPFLQNQSQRFSPLSQILVFPDNCDRLPLELVDSWHLEDVCDVNNSIPSMTFFRFNFEKAVNVLETKVQAMSECFSKQRLRYESMNSTSSIFDISLQLGQGAGSIQEDNSSINKEDIIQSLQIISDYISDDLISALSKRFNLSDADMRVKSPAIKRKSDWEASLEVISIACS